MAEQAVITTNWVNIDDGTGEFVNTPQVTQDHTFIKWTDITGQPSENIPTSPNQYNILLQAETVDMDAIAADTRYQIMPGTRQPVEGPVSSQAGAIPQQTEFDTLRAELLQNLDDVDEPAWTVEDLDTAIGTTPNDRTNLVITEAITNYTKRRRKRDQEVVTMVAAQQDPPNDTQIGYRRNGTGTLTPNEFGGNQIQQLWTNGIHVTANLRDPITGDNRFNKFIIRPNSNTGQDRQKFRRADGEIFNNNTAIRWTTTYEFVAGETYKIVFVE